MPVTISGGADPNLIVPLVREQPAVTVPLVREQSSETVGLTSGGTVTIEAVGGTVTITPLPPLPAEPVYLFAMTPSVALTAIAAATQGRNVAIGAEAATQFLAAVVEARSAQVQAQAAVEALGAQRVARRIDLSVSAGFSPLGGVVEGAQVEARNIQLTSTAALSAIGASTVSRSAEITASAQLSPVGAQVEARGVEASVDAKAQAIGAQIEVRSGQIASAVEMQASGAQVEARSAQASSASELQPVGGRIVSRSLTMASSAATNFIGEAATAGYDPATLFAAGELGAWYDPSDLSTLAQNSDGTGAVTAGDPVGYMGDKSGNGLHATATGTARPILRTDGTYYWLEFNGTTHVLTTAATASTVSNTDGMLLGIAVQASTSHGFEMAQYNVSSLRVWSMPDIAEDGEYNFSVQETTNFVELRRANVNSLNTKDVVTAWWQGADTLSNIKRSDGTTAAGTVTTPSTTSVNEEIKIGGYRADFSPGDLYGAIIRSKYTSADEADVRSYLNGKIGI